MEMADEPSTSVFVRSQKNHRSLPIPKVVNNFLLKKYGAIYYSSSDCSEKAAILKQIEIELKTSGYNISWSEVERRLKNMKSHYRRKKSDLDRGLICSVEWEYYRQLDDIFAALDPEPIRSADEQKDETKVQTPVKSIMNPKLEIKTQPEEEKPEVPKPQDLSAKRPRLIEFCHVSDLTSQIPVKKLDQPEPKEENPEQLNIAKVIENMKAVDQYRLILDQQRVNLEICRYEVDVIGCQLSELLYKMTHPSSPNSNETSESASQ